MNVSNIIVDFANTNKEFRTNDLSEYLSGKIELSKKMLSWHLRKLLDEKKIFRISKGVYTTTPKVIFRPVPNAHSIRLYKKLKAVYPLLDFCVYNGEILSDLQHHLSYNNNIYIETERDATETISTLYRICTNAVSFRQRRMLCPIISGWTKDPLL